MRFHLGTYVILAVAYIGLLGPVDILFPRLVPEKSKLEVVLARRHCHTKLVMAYRCIFQCASGPPNCLIFAIAIATKKQDYNQNPVPVMATRVQPFTVFECDFIVARVRLGTRRGTL